MDPQREAKRAYKQNPPAAGIYAVRNLPEQKLFIGSALNVQGKLNGVRFTLEHNSHYTDALQADWNRLGPDAFTFEVLDVLEPAAGALAVERDDLDALEALWLEKLQPFGPHGYHTPKAGT